MSRDTRAGELELCSLNTVQDARKALTSFQSDNGEAFPSCSSNRAAFRRLKEQQMNTLRTLDSQLWTLS